MKILIEILSRNGVRLAGMAVIFCALGASMLSFAAPAQTMTLVIVNNSAKEIRHLYLSPAENDNWGVDQLNGSSIGPGATRTLNVTWEQSTVKVVAEDEDGCFLTTTVEVTGSVQWTITSDSARNCGS